MDPVDLALERFGLGARPGDRERMRDPVRWLTDQITPAAATHASLATFGSARDLQIAGAALSNDDRKRQAKTTFAIELKARVNVAFTTDTPFAERWVRHFSNHFSVSTRRLQTSLFVGAFEREVARAHAFGRFSDMLLASTQHPAMLAYLDNEKSIGPESTYAQRPARSNRTAQSGNVDEPGLNENLAREVLELHTLGADGGYTQDDVRALANLLTGWGSDERNQFGGGFYFDDKKHQPGSVTLLGKRYGEGLAEGVRALTDLAAHPSTARNVSRRLAKHFRIDHPAEIAALEASFIESGGRLDLLAKLAVGLGWSGAARVRTPDDWVTALVRASGGSGAYAAASRGSGRPNAERRARPEGGGRPKRDGAMQGERKSGGGGGIQRDPWVSAMRSLDQPTWGTPTPEGWADDEASWTGPEQLVRRVEVAAELAAWLTRSGSEAFTNVQQTLVPRMSVAGRTLFERAGDRTTALTLAFCAPEVLRR